MSKETKDPNYEGVFDGLNADVAMYQLAAGKDDQGLEVKVMTAADARRQIERRLMFGAIFLGGVHPHRELSAEIVRWMPNDLLYGKVIESLDLRPFLTAYRPVAEAAGRQLEVENIDIALSKQDEWTRAALDETAADNNLDDKPTEAKLDMAAGTYVANPRAIGFAPDVQIRNADAEGASAVAAGQMTQEQADNAIYDAASLDLDGGKDVTEERYVFPVQTLREMISNGYIQSLQELSKEEVDESRASGVVGYVPIDVGKMGPAVASAVPGEMRPERTVLNAFDAKNWIHTLKPSEVANLQKGMALGGYMDNVEGNPQYDEGYSRDLLTLLAFDRVLLDAARSGQSVPAMLFEQTQRTALRRREEVAATKFQDMRAAANSMSMEVLGRELTDDEQTTVRSFLQTLQGNRVGDASGMTDVSGYSGQNAIAPLLGAGDLATGVQNVIGGEAAARDGFNTAQTVLKAFGQDMTDPKITEMISQWRSQNRPAWMDEEY